MVNLAAYRELDAIRLIGDMVRAWWKLEIAIADESGYVLDHAEGKIFPSRNEFCRHALFSPEGFRRCNDSVRVVRDKLKSRRRRGEGPIVHQCHMGFDIVAAPIRLDGALAGFLFAGGAYHAEPSRSARSDLLRKVRELEPVRSPDTDAPDGGAVASVPRLSADDIARLRDLLERGAQAIARCHADRASSARRRGDDPGAAFTEIVGRAPAMRAVYELLAKIARSESTVLVHGESGTGKELLARAIHAHGPRADRPFVVQNCAALNDNLLDSALFGHVRGSFTGAVRDHKGLFQVADRGTLFLDEIGEMSPALQVKLLRVLQEGTVTPVGATEPVRVDVRIVAASHRDLAAMVDSGAFRQDLYYRVNVLAIELPPLRDRIDDLDELCGHFLRRHSRGEPPRIARDAMDAMRRYHWPGNIRELENEIERLTVLAGDRGEIDAALLSPRIRDAAPVERHSGREAAPAAVAAEHAGTLREAVERVEAEVIGKGLIRTHWNKTKLAKELGISRSSLIHKCSYYGLDRHSDRGDSGGNGGGRRTRRKRERDEPARGEAKQAGRRKRAERG